MSKINFVTLIAFMTTFMFACTPTQPGSQTDGKPQILVTTSILADVVSQIGGENIHLSTLLPRNTDPHSFEPAPKDLAVIAKAELIFINGLGLEEFITRLIFANEIGGQVVLLSENIPTLTTDGIPDPHVWLDPRNLVSWTEVIAAELSALDPDNAEEYRSNAAAYQIKLIELHAWATAELEPIPPDRRKLVTDHDSLGYFAAAYDLEVIGAVIPNYSTLAEPSAQEIVALQNAIKAQNAPAIFVNISLNPALVDRLAEDTGIQIVPLYVGSLSALDGPAPTYLDMIRFNVTAIRNALQP